MADIDDPSRYNVRQTEFPPTQVVPAVQKQSVIAGTLANGAQQDFEFNMDATPLLDMILSADRDLTVRLFVRINENDTFRQYGGDTPISASTTTYVIVFSGQRLQGSMLRVRILNTSGALATLSTEMQVRSS